MKTLTFYSYKGGVGRTLALTHMAMRLVEYGKKVAILDFDLEAPGVHFKFGNYFQIPSVKRGVVDYIYDFTEKNILNADLEDFNIQLPARNKYQHPINIIPAGNIESGEYWKKLSRINWHNLFYDEDSKGVAFFLDLKEKIKNKFNPDYLLIDSRTGITDISGITLKILADDIVILSVNNEENLFGSKRIIKNLLANEFLITGSKPKITFLLTRLPFLNTTKDRANEYELVEKRKLEFQDYLGIGEFEINVIHSDRRLELDEKFLIEDFDVINYSDRSLELNDGFSMKDKIHRNAIEHDYLKIFHLILKDYITSDEIEVFQNKKEAEKLYLKSVDISDNIQESLKLVNKAIELDNTNAAYYSHKGDLMTFESKFTEAIDLYNKSIELNNSDPFTFYKKGIAYNNRNMFSDAIALFDDAIKMDPLNDLFLYAKASALEYIDKREALKLWDFILTINPNNIAALNNRAHINRILGNFQLAYEDIAKAIEMRSDFYMLYGTIAEIQAEMGKIEEFYLNLTIALVNGISVKELKTAQEVYSKFKDESRFQNLMIKYGIDIDELFFKGTS